MTLDEALTMALEESAIGPTNNTPTGRDSFLLALAAGGYAVVPVEATEKMIDALLRTGIEVDGWTNALVIGDMQQGYRDMLAAAQEDSHE